MQLWVEKRGGAEDGEKLEFSSELSSIIPLFEEGKSLSCVHLSVEAQLINVYGCVVSVRYEGDAKWQDIVIPDQVCQSEDFFLKTLAARLDRMRIVRREGTAIDIEVTKHIKVSTSIEYKFNENLAAILGVNSEVAYTGRIVGSLSLNALLEKVVVVSPLVAPSAFLNAGQLRSLGAFRLLAVGETSGLVAGAERLVGASAGSGGEARCFSTLLSRIAFSLNSLLIPSLVLRARSFRVLACFELK